MFFNKIVRDFNFQFTEAASTRQRRRNLYGFRVKILLNADQVLRAKGKDFKDEKSLVGLFGPKEVPPVSTIFKTNLKGQPGRSTLHVRELMDPV